MSKDIEPNTVVFSFITPKTRKKEISDLTFFSPLLYSKVTFTTVPLRYIELQAHKWCRSVPIRTVYDRSFPK